MYTIDELIDTFSDKRKRGNAPVTGIKELDCFLENSDSVMTLIASRPAMGRMSVALTAIVNKMKENPEYSVVIFSMEHALDSLTARLLSIYSGINVDDIRKNKVSGEDLGRYEAAKAFFRGKNLRITDNVPLSKCDLLTSFLKVKNENDGRLDLIVIDSLDAILPDCFDENMFQVDCEIPYGAHQDMISLKSNYYLELCKDLKLHAEAFECHVIAFATLSRLPESRFDHRPQMIDLLNYGSIISACDTVLLLYRDEYYSDQAKEGSMEINVAKNLGMKGLAEVCLDKKTTGIREISFEEDIYKSDTDEGEPLQDTDFLDSDEENVSWE